MVTLFPDVISGRDSTQVLYKIRTGELYTQTRKGKRLIFNCENNDVIGKGIGKGLTFYGEKLFPLFEVSSTGESSFNFREEANLCGVDRVH